MVVAAKEIKRQLRITARACRKLTHRRIKPLLAARVVLRSVYKIVRALSLLSLLLVGGGIFATLIVSTRLFYKVRSSRLLNRT